MEKNVFEFPKKKVFIKPIHRKGGWLPANHDGSFMFSGTKQDLRIFESQLTGNLIIDMLPEEQAALEKAMGVEEGFLNPNRPKDKNFWRLDKTKLVLTKDGLNLDLSRHDHYILYIIAKSNVLSGLISPNWDSRFDKGSYKFALSDSEEETRNKVVKMDSNKNVWMAYGAISNSVAKMDNCLRVLAHGGSMKMPKRPTESFLKTELEKFIESAPDKFLKVASDPDLAVRGDVLRAIEDKAILKDGFKFYIADNPESKMLFEDLIKHLKDPENQDVYLKIKEKVQTV